MESITPPKNEENSEDRPGKGLFLFVGRYWHILFLFLLITVFTVNNAWFIANDRSPIVADMAEHLPYTRNTYRILFEVPGVKDILIYRNAYEPLVHYTTAATMKVFGLSIPVALWSLYPFSIIMILAIFGVGNHFGGKAGGAAAALIGTSNCYFLDYSHLYMQDIAHAALTCLAFYLLLKTDAFKKPLYSWLFGLVLGLSLLARFSSAFYLLAPVIILFLYISLRNFRIFLFTSVSLSIIGVMEYYFLKTGIMLAKTHIDPKPAIFAQLQIFCIVVIILFLITVILKRFRNAVFGEKHADYANMAITAIRSILIALVVSQPWFIVSSAYLFERLLWHTGGHPLTDREFIIKNLFINYNTINNFFPLVFFMAAAGIIFAIIKKVKPLDMAMLVSMGVIGFFLSSLTASPFSRYFLAEILVLSVLAGYWVHYTGIFKFPIFSYIGAYSVLMLLFPFFSPHVPGFWEVYDLEYNNPVYFSPVYATNPTPDTYRLYAIADDIKGAKDKYFQNDNDYRLLLQLAPDFAKLNDYPGRNAGMMSERSLADLYGRNLIRVMWFKGMPFPEDGIMENANMDDYLEINRAKPVFLVVGYEDPDYPTELINKIESQYGRKTERVSAYCIFDKKKINVYLIYPEGR
jgi:hypothetical protein